jgi:hypothetical protein
VEFDLGLYSPTGTVLSPPAALELRHSVLHAIAALIGGSVRNRSAPLHSAKVGPIAIRTSAECDVIVRAVQVLLFALLLLQNFFHAPLWWFAQSNPTLRSLHLYNVCGHPPNEVVVELTRAACHSPLLTDFGLNLVEDDVMSARNRAAPLALRLVPLITV